MSKILKEPLFHFLAAGLLLFLLFSLVNRDNNLQTGRRITVDKDSLLTFMQYRSRAFKPSVAEAQLAAMTDRQLQEMVDNYVREESLYREAKSLGLDANDFIVRQRLVKSIEFITEGFIDTTIKLNEKDVDQYYVDNKSDYFVKPHVTFTHVFFDSDKHERDRALALANSQLQELNTKQIPFEKSPQYGDRFPYHVNYVERGAQFVASHFGAAMSASLFEVPADKIQWQGPFESPYGFHLVLLTNRADGFFPTLDEIRERVSEDARRLGVAEQKDAAIKRIVDSYEVDMRPLDFNPGGQNVNSQAMSE